MIDKHSKRLYWKPANQGGRTSEKSALPESHAETGRKFQNPCFGNSGKSPKACNSLCTFILEKQVNPSRKSELCGILTGPIPCPSIQLCGSLEYGQPAIAGKASSPAVARRSRKEMGLLQSFISRKLSLFDLSGCSLDDLTCMAVSIWTDSYLAHLKCLFPESICQKHLGTIV